MKNNKSTCLSCSLACGLGRLDIVEFLMANGADPEIDNLFGETCFNTGKAIPCKQSWQSIHFVAALAKACRNGHFALVDYLIKHGVNINTKDLNAMTGLHNAVLANSYESVDLIAQQGVNVNVRNFESMTPIKYARCPLLRKMSEYAKCV